MIVAVLYSVIRHNVFKRLPGSFSQQAMMGDVLFVDVFRQKR